MTASGNEMSMTWFFLPYDAMETLVLSKAFQNDPTCIPGVSDELSDEMKRVIELCRSRRVALRDRFFLAIKLKSAMHDLSGARLDKHKKVRRQFRDDSWEFILECRKELPGVYFKELVPAFDAMMKALDDPRRAAHLEADSQNA